MEGNKLEPAASAALEELAGSVRVRAAARRTRSLPSAEAAEAGSYAADAAQLPGRSPIEAGGGGGDRGVRRGEAIEADENSGGGVGGKGVTGGRSPGGHAGRGVRGADRGRPLEGVLEAVNDSAWGSSRYSNLTASNIRY